MRIFRLLATPVILIGLLIFLLWGASWGWSAMTAPFPGPPPTPCVSQKLGSVTPKEVTVRVFNGGSTDGLGSTVSQALKTAGFEVSKTKNTEEQITKTIIRAGSNNAEAAKLVASYLVEPTMETDSRVDGTVDVLIGSKNDFQGMSESGLSEGPVESGTICLAPSPSPSM